MPNRLSMTANQGCSSFGIRRMSCIGLHFGGCFRQFEPIDGRQGSPLSCCDQLSPELSRIRGVPMAKQLPAGLQGCAVEAGQHGIDTICAGAAHQAEAEHGVGSGLGQELQVVDHPHHNKQMPFLQNV